MARLDNEYPRSGFSLVELLTVIGIIAILIGMLMPTLTRARESAKLVQCQANLRTIYTAAQIHANDHHGYLPASGWHWNPDGGILNPHGLRDDRATRYIYYDDAGTKRPVPITVALAISLGAKVRLDSRENLEEDMQSEQLRKYFRCPSQEVELRGLTQKSSEPWEAPRDWSSYVFNEAILGLREKATTTEPTLGMATRVKRSTEVMFAMDGRPRDQLNDNWLMVPDKGPQDTLWNFQQMVTAPNTGYGKQLLDFLRHRYRADVVFMDGHVESISMTHAGLDSVGVSKGVHD
jgi:prepilin-type N-terminal cleavage/methylation domain-containing protein